MPPLSQQPDPSLKLIEAHPRNPQPRQMQQVARHLKQGMLCVYPADSGYRFGWLPEQRAVVDRVRRLRGTAKEGDFVLACKDLSHAARYAKIDNSAHRIIRANTPGNVTFVLPATRQVCKPLINPRRKTIGIQIPAHPVATALLDLIDCPLATSSMVLPGIEIAPADSEEIERLIGGQLDLLVSCGFHAQEEATVLDLTMPA